MSANPNPQGMSRRKALQALAGSAGLVMSLPVWAQSGKSPAPPPGWKRVESYQPKSFNRDQIAAIALLSELVIPTDEHSPGAIAAEVYAYIDDIVAADGERSRRNWLRGLKAVEKEAANRYGKAFLQCAPEQQLALLEDFSRNESKPRTAAERFFVTLKRATIDGYYNSSIGIHQDLQYQGNTYLLAFPGCTRMRGL